MKEILKYVIVLSIICAVSATLLNYVNSITKGPIAQKIIEAENQKLKTVIRSEPKDMKTDTIDNCIVYYSPTHYAVKVTATEAFSGTFLMIIGMDSIGNYIDSRILDHKETPGLGSKMTDPDFYSQFEKAIKENKAPKLAKDGGTIDAIAGATISSRSYANGIQKALDVLDKFKNKSKEINNVQ